MNAPNTDPNSVWPSGQSEQVWLEPTVRTIRFEDHGDYHNELRDAVLANAENPKFAKTYDASSGIGTVKVFDLANWGSVAATLIHERALTLFRRTMSTEEAYPDLTWASIYQHGTFCLPHSHPRTYAGVLYMLDQGDSGDAASGRFCFADPRMKMCCREQPGYMSTPCAPDLAPGTMMIFPGQIVHFVSPYDGTRPRITLTWNLNLVAQVGNPLPESARPAG